MGNSGDWQSEHGLQFVLLRPGLEGDVHDRSAGKSPDCRLAFQTNWTLCDDDHTADIGTGYGWKIVYGWAEPNSQQCRVCFIPVGVCRIRIHGRTYTTESGFDQSDSTPVAVRWGMLSMDRCQSGAKAGIDQAVDCSTEDSHCSVDCLP